MMLAIHETRCPALCHKMFATNIPNVGDVAFLCEHLHGHACSCNPPSPEALAELVEAARLVQGRIWWGSSIRPTRKDHARLDAALKPFTKENQ